MESKRQRRLRLTTKWAAYSLMLLVAATLFMEYFRKRLVVKASTAELEVKQSV